jgi:hypothetical protein
VKTNPQVSTGCKHLIYRDQAKFNDFKYSYRSVLDSLPVRAMEYIFLRAAIPWPE